MTYKGVAIHQGGTFYTATVRGVQLRSTEMQGLIDMITERLKCI